MNIKDITNLAQISAFTGEFAIYSTEEGKEGIINRKGEIVLEANKYDYVFREMDNFIYTVACDGAPVEYFDAEEREMVQLSTLEIYRAKHWEENIIVISNKDGKGALNLTTGENVLPCKYALVSYKKQYNVILVKEKDGKYGLFDEEGKEVIPVEYDYMNISKDKGLDEIAVKKDGRCYFINVKQEEVKVF